MGTRRAYAGTRKPIEAPSLRRDPTAVVKLAILSRWERCAKAEGCEVSKLPQRAKAQLEKDWAWDRESILRWAKVKSRIMAAVARLRLGLRGLKPFGSNAKTATSNHNQNQGARLRESRTGIPSKVQPLEAVMHRVKAWLDNERAHGHEVRKKTILTRLKYELEFEVDRQIVLQEHKSPSFSPFALRSSQARLTSLSITNTSKQQEWWFDSIVCPRIGAISRTGQKLSECVNKKVLHEKHQLTWATILEWRRPDIWAPKSPHPATTWRLGSLKPLQKQQCLRQFQSTGCTAPKQIFETKNDLHTLRF